MYTWDFIQTDWLLNNEIAPSPEQAVNSFNKVASLLGRDWVEGTRAQNGVKSAGTSPTLYIIALGTMLDTLSDVAFGETFLSKLSEQDRDCRAELEAMYLFRRSSATIQIEYEPAAIVGETVRRPDFRVRQNTGSWLYVEVTRPSTSEAQAAVNNQMQRLSSAVESGSRDFSVEVFLEREPSSVEVEAIYGFLTNPHNHELTGPAPLGNGLGTLFWNTMPPCQPELVDRGGPFTPRIGVVGFSKGPGRNRHVCVRWPFADGRAAEVLKKEAKQLPVDAPGIIMMQASAPAGATTTWRPLIERRFQPNIHTRVGGVCIWTLQQIATPSGDDWRPQVELITNPYARHPLPNWAVEQLRSSPVG